MENKMIPKLRFPEFEGEWVIEKVKNVFSIFNGYAFSSTDSVNEGTLWVKIADVGIQEMKIDNLSYLPDNFKSKYSKFILKNGDYVVALTRPILNGKLKIAQINELFNNSLLNQRVGKLVSDKNLNYVYYLLQNKRLIKSIENNIAGSDPPNLAPKEINNIKVGLPSPKEQTKIANFLTAVDKRINLLQKKKAAMEQYKKGVMQKLFSQSIRFKDENGNDFPDWEEKKLGEVAEITTGNSNRQDSIIGGEYTFFDRSEDIRTSNIFLFDGEAIIIGGEGSSFIPKYFVGKFDLHQRTYAIMNFRGAIGRFLYYYIYFFKNYFLSQAVGSTVKSLRLPMFLKMPIKQPTIQEQHKIANFLSTIDKSIEKLGNQIDDTKMFKKGLLQKMFV